MAEVEILDCIPDAGQVVQLQIDAAGEEVVAQIDVLGIAELFEQIPGIAPEGVVADVDAAQVLQLPDPVGGEAVGEVVVGEVEVDEAVEVGEAARDGPVEAVPREVEVAQRGEGADSGGQAAGEGVPGEGEVLERPHARERRHLELPGEAEAIERDADHRAAVAHHAAPRGGAAPATVAGLGGSGRGPGPQHGVPVPVRDALLELEQRRHVVAGGAPGKKQENESEENSHRCGGKWR